MTGRYDPFGPLDMTTPTRAELEAAYAVLPPSPVDSGRLELIVRRPRVGARELVDAGELTIEEGLVGDSWGRRWRRNAAAQLTLMNSRVIALIAREADRRPLAGDQLYVDLDLSVDNLPPGTRLQIGSAIIEVSAKPHTGCGKFVQRFGVDAMEWVNAPEGRRRRLRGLNARVVQAGALRTGDLVRKV